MIVIDIARVSVFVLWRYKFLSIVELIWLSVGANCGCPYGQVGVLVSIGLLSLS